MRRVSRSVSLRLDPDLYERLTRRAKQSSRTLTQVTTTYLDEALRQEAHPGIVFRDGPAGRRAGLHGGPDVWEVARVVRGLRRSGERAAPAAVELTGLSLEQVRTATGYYTDYRQEIDEWIERVDRESEQAESNWLREQQLLG